jgi:hypothetical protein
LGKTDQESKDKISVDLSLAKLIGELRDISAGICDSTSRGNKSWRIMVQNNLKFKNSLLYNCFWYKKKELPTDFNKHLTNVKN